MFGPKRNRLESLYNSLGGTPISPPGMRTGDIMPPIGSSFNANNTSFEDIIDTEFGDKNVQNFGITWGLWGSNVGIADVRYKLKQIIFGWRNHVVVIEESDITPDDADLVFFEMPELNVFDDESPDSTDSIYLFLCTGSGVTVVSPDANSLYSTL